jgi:hypothetical protein
MLVTIDGQAGLIISENGTVTAKVLIELGSVVPKLREIAPERKVIPGQLYRSVGVAAKTRRSDLLGGQATAEFVPPLKDTDTHAGILDQVHGQVKGLGPTANYHRIKRFIGHYRLLLKSLISAISPSLTGYVSLL